MIQTHLNTGPGVVFLAPAEPRPLPYDQSLREPTCWGGVRWQTSPRSTLTAPRPHQAHPLAPADFPRAAPGAPALPSPRGECRGRARPRTDGAFSPHRATGPARQLTSVPGLRETTGQSQHGAWAGGPRGFRSESKTTRGDPSRGAWNDPRSSYGCHLLEGQGGLLCLSFKGPSC